MWTSFGGPGVLFLILGGLWACNSDFEGAQGFSVRDSAGIAVVDIGSVADAPRWGLSTDPDLEIGAVDGSEAYMLDRVQTAFELSDGTIVVADGGSSELRFFDAQGHFLQAAGGEGGGPSEFRRISSAGPFQGDSIWVYDAALNRLSVFDGTGAFGRTTSIDAVGEGDRPPTIIGTLSDGTLVGRVVPAAESEPNGYQRRPLVVHLLGPDGSHRTQVGVFPGRELYEKIESPRAGVFRTQRRTLPFARSSRVVASDATLAVGTTDDYEFRIFGLDGNVQRVVRRTDMARTPVSDALYDQFVEFLVDQMDEMQYQGNAPTPESIRRTFQDLPRVSGIPMFADLRVAEDESIWISNYALPWAEEDSAEWSVFDLEGRVRGRIRIPRNLEITQIGEDHILGIARDELGVQFVRRFAILRPRTG